MTLGALKSMIEPFIDIPAGRQQIFFNNRSLPNESLTLEGVGIREGDMISVFKSQPQQRQAQQPRRNDAEVFRIQALADRNVLEQLRQRFPALADAVNDPTRFSEIFNEAARNQRQQEIEKQKALEKLNDDPFDVEAQKKIEEIIRQERVQENLDEALEKAPEGT